MSMRFRYPHLNLSRVTLTSRGLLVRAKPLVNITLVGPTGSRLVQGLLDTGADECVFPETLAPSLGVDLSKSPEHSLGGFGGIQIARVRYAWIHLRLADNNERREWAAWVGFTNSPLRFALLGIEGMLRYFTATFRGDLEEVELVVNSLYPGT